LRIHEEETHFQDSELIEVAKNLELQKDIKNYTSLRIGELFLDKYRIVKVLGRGNSSIIYLLVSNDESQKLFVLKEFFPKGLVERTEKEEVVVKSTLTKAELKNYHLMQEIFIGEAQNLMRVSSKKHPNVVHFLTAKSNINNTNYYIMSYEEGHTLKIYIENLEKSDGRKLNSKEIIQLAEGLLQGISHVHSAGVYHQDIKLENILIRNDGSPIIVDFGASVLVHDKENNKYYNTATLKYAAPEQITMDNPPKINKTTDIYNIGVLLYRLITGSFPPKADERKKSLENTGSDIYQKLIEQNLPGYNKSLLKAVDKSLNLAQSERFQNAEEFEEALHKRYVGKSFIIVLSVPILLALIYFAWPSSKKSIVATNKIEQKIVSEKKDTSIETHTVTIESDISDIRYLLNGEKINDNTFLAKEGKIYTILAIAEGYEPQEYTIDYATLSKNDFVLKNTMLDNKIEDLEIGTDLSAYSEEKKDTPIPFPKEDEDKDEDEIALYLPTPVDEEETVVEIPTIPVDEITPEFVAPIVSANKPIVKSIDSEDKLQKKVLLRQKRELEKKKALQQSRAKAQRIKSEKRRVEKRRKAAKEKAEKRRKATLEKQKIQKRRIAKKRALEKRALEKRKAKKRKAKKRNQSISSSVWYCVARTGNIIKSAKKSTRSSAKSTALWSCKKYSRGKGVCRVSCYLWK
jgi:serine/threonine protein kinase